METLPLKDGNLGCTDAAPRLAHPRPTRWDAGGTSQTARPCRVVPRHATWQFPNRADAVEIGADAVEIGADAAEIGPTRSVSAVSACIG